MVTERELLEEATAESIVDEALAGYERTVPPGRLAEVRAYMIAKLLATRGGRERLRRIAPDPVVTESGESDTVGATPIKKGKQGGGAA